MPTSPSPPPASRSPSPPDIAAAMGFASFGAKPNPPKKKRKITGADGNNEGSGSNNTPLGIRVGAGKEWEGGGGEQVGVGFDARGFGGGAGVEGDGDGNDDGERVPLVGGEGGSIGNPACTTVPISSERPRDSARVVRKLGDEKVLEAARQRGLNRLGQVGGEGRRADGGWDWNALRRGIRDERGDMAFYDASFVEDPWRELRGGAAARSGFGLEEG